MLVSGAVLSIPIAELAIETGFIAIVEEYTSSRVGFISGGRKK